MNRSRSRIRVRSTASVRPVPLFAALVVLALSGVVLLSSGPPAAAQPAPVTITTPYTDIAVQPGSSVQLDLDIAATTSRSVELNVAAPDGWRTTLRGGGFVVGGVTAGPGEPTTVQLDVNVPGDVAAGEHQIQVTAATDAGQTQLDITFTVQEQVDSGVNVTADFPSLRGGPTDTFTYTLTVTNNTPREQSFNFSARGPSGWDVTASPVAEQQAITISIEPGSTSDVTVEATPTESTEAGEYPITVEAVADNGATGSIELAAEVTGTPQLELQTADGQLNVDGQAGDTTNETLVVSNTGSAPLEDVQFSSSPPGDWEVTFEPSSIDAVQPGETAQVVAEIRPTSDAVAGDYALGVTANAGQASSTLDLRYSVETSSFVGIIAAVVIAAAVVVLGVVYWRFGRR